MSTNKTLMVVLMVQLSGTMCRCQVIATDKLQILTNHICKNRVVQGPRHTFVQQTKSDKVILLTVNINIYVSKLLITAL